MPEILFFPYFGPNRRSDKRVVEIRLDFNHDPADAPPVQLDAIRGLLTDEGLLAPQDRFPVVALPDEPMEWYAALLAQTALLFQRTNGHQVQFFQVSPIKDKKRCTALVEYLHCDVGMTAVKLAVALLNERRQSLTDAFQRFAGFAMKRRLPAETAAIIKAAKHRDIPHYQLEQAPFAGNFKSAHRVRPNGLLMLGHGVDSNILDGTFCVNQSDDYRNALLRNTDLRIDLLQQLGLQAVIGNQNQVTNTARIHLLVINKQILPIGESDEGHKRLVDDIHPSIVDIAVKIVEKTGDIPLAVSLWTQDISRPLTETGGKVLDFELAPDLDVLLGPCKDSDELLASAASDLIDWLYPAGNARMPTIAVTGTNGKTTTCRIINHILTRSGIRPGLVCTDGVFLDGQQVSDQDASSLIGHFKVLSSRAVDAAVLETHHRGIAVRGFAYDHCDVAVCLNVTEEHLVEGEIESIEEMTEIKRALVERASGAAVIFADDANCVSMLPHLRAKRLCLVSLESGIAQLRESFGTQDSVFCVLEAIENRDWLVLYDRDTRIELIAVGEVPATFDGTARFNTSNVMHAAAAAYLHGVKVEAIRTALETFSASLEMTPGRMNVFNDLPFKVVMDFAHNPDGMKKVSEFSDRQGVTGRKLIAIPGAETRSDDANRLCAQSVAGHFDHYFCIEYDRDWPRKRKLVAPLIRDALIEAGVSEQQTRVMGSGKEVIMSILDSCEPGDLLILLAGHVGIKTFPEYLREYADR